MSGWRRSAAVLAVVCAAGGCKGSKAGGAGPRDAAADGALGAGAVGGQGPGGDASADARSAERDRAAPALGAPTPADDAMPERNDEINVRARHLLEAIASDDASLASDILFPRDGWIATRDATDPGKDWDKHVEATFRRSVHALSRRRDELGRAQFVSLELGPTIEQVTPGPHRWKKPLWMVHGSRMTFVVDGRTRTLSVREMIAWRGAWYVTRLR
jgi:hypothetical protein